MKKLLLAIVAAMFLATGCATIKPEWPPCPPEDAIIFVPNPMGYVSPVAIPKDFFADTDNWVPEKKYDEEMEKRQGNQVGIDKKGI